MERPASSINPHWRSHRHGLVGWLLGTLLLSMAAPHANAQQVGASVDWRRCDDGTAVDKSNLSYRLQIRSVSHQPNTSVFKATILVNFLQPGTNRHYQLAPPVPNSDRKGWCFAEYQPLPGSPADGQLPRVQFTLENVAQPSTIIPAFKAHLDKMPVLSATGDGWYRLSNKDEGITYADLIYDYLNRHDVNVFPDFQLDGFLRVDTLFVNETPYFSRHRTGKFSLGRYKLPQPEHDYRTVVRKELLDAAGAKLPTPEMQRSQPSAPTLPLAGGGPKDYLLRVDNPQFALLGPESIRHFGYCTAVVKAETTNPTTFRLSGCQPTASGTIPIKLPGFDVVWIDNGGAAVDSRLQVSAVDTMPYPLAWKTERFARIPRGSLANLLLGRLEVSLDGHFPDCSRRLPLTVKDVLALESAGLTIQPACQEFELTASPAIAARATVTAGCQGTRRLNLHQSIVRCWRPIASPDAVEIALELPGFELIKIPVSAADIEAGRVVVPESQVLPALRPRLALPPRATEAGLPPYKATTIQFMTDKAVCGLPVAWTGGTMPTVSEARCTQAPNRIKVLFALEADVAERENMPPRAFRPTLEREHSLDGQPIRPFGLPDVARELPIRFTGDRGKEYDRSFGHAFANEIYSGVYLYQPPMTQAEACDPIERGRNERFVRFVPDSDEAKRPALRMRWPVTARVIDKDRRALSQCAAGVVQGSEADPYWTFNLKPARASGKRKLVVIAVSPDFVAGGPGVSRQAAVKASLQQLVERLAADLKKNGQLAAMDVYTVTGSDDFVPLFTGEEAAMEPQSSKARLTDSLAPTGSNVPNITRFENLMDVKSMSDLIVVMHGGTATPARESVYALEALALRLGKPNARLLLSADSCQRWQEATRQSIECTVVGGDTPKVKGILDAALTAKGAN